MNLHMAEVLSIIDYQQKSGRPTPDQGQVVRLKARIARRPGLWRAEMPSRRRRQRDDICPTPDAA